MIVKTLPINEIIVENRRREDFGDIKKLSESIAKYGLFHPPVVDDKNNLVAGERRLRACKMLGWFEIPTRYYQELSEAERDEIELEENLQRKDLTAYEQSRNIVKLAEVATTILENQDLGLKGDDFLSHDGTKTIGRPQGSGKPTNIRAVSERIGIPKSTISRAKVHVEAVEKHPELVHVPTQKDAINIAKTLDIVDEKKQAEIKKDLAKGEVGKVTKVIQEYQREYPKGKDPEVNWTDTIYKIRRTLNGINLHGGIVKLWSKWSAQARKSYYQSVCDLSEKLNTLRNEMEEYFENER